MIKEESWCSNEFSGIRFGDRRLEIRFVQTAERLSGQPLDPINKACGSWAETKAAYRMFANEKVRAEEIMSSHRGKTLSRMRGERRVLAVQDSSSINFGERLKTRHKGLGPVGNKEDCKSFGFIMHTTLAVSLKGVSLGILDQQLWSRENESVGEGSHTRRRTENKESQKWFTAAERLSRFVPPEVEMIHVSDREADIYEYLAFAQERGISFLIRARLLDRLVMDHNFYPLSAILESEPICKRQTVQVPERKNGEAARVATVGIRFKKVELYPPPQRTRIQKDQEPLKSIKVCAIYVMEIDPPQNVVPLEWMLLTNVSTDSPEEAQERIEWYRMRWHIEMFHKVLKSGCQVEACQLEGAERLKKYVSLFSVIAWRLYWMTHLSRKAPELPCTELLEDAEWKALYCRIKKSRDLPERPPSLREAVRWIAQLGGFLARKGDGEPGPIVIWRGWQRLTDITEDWILFNGGATCG